MCPWAVKPAKLLHAPKPTSLSRNCVHSGLVLNQDWHPDVIAQWEHAGALSNIEMTLGYRFVIKEIEAPNQVVAGNKLSMSIRVETLDQPFNKRPVTLLLEQGSRRIEVPYSMERQWLPGTERRLHARCTCRGLLSVPGESVFGYPTSERQKRPEYALRFANEATWDPAVGTNVVGWIDVVQ